MGTNQAFCVFMESLTFVVCFIHFLIEVHGKLPLKADTDSVEPNHTPGCRLGGKFYELEKKWSPELEPTGIMYCVKCTCLPIIKKGFLYQKGKVSCKNIKRQCPKPHCDNPVLRRGKCCKTCPGQDNYLPAYDEGTIVKGENSDFTALLVGSHFRSTVATKSVAIADIGLRNSNLYFSLRYAGLKKLKLVQFVHKNGNILYERSVEKLHHYKQKVCGVWRKVPSLYQQYLRKTELSVAITTAQYPSGEVLGQINYQKSKTKETLSAVLTSRSVEGVGGRASLEYDKRRKAINYHITVTDLLESGKTREKVFVTIGRKRRFVYQDKKVLSNKKTTISGTWPKLKKRISRKLAQGKLKIKVTSQSGRTLRGKILPRMTCGAFQAVLSSNEIIPENPTSAIGSAVLVLRDNGKIDYKVRVLGVDSKVRRITIEKGSNRKRKRRRVDKISKYFQPDGTGFGGWANGTYRKRKFKDINLFLNEKLFISVATKSHRRGELRGKIVELPYHEQAGELPDFPVLLMSPPGKSTGAAGHTWITVDHTCVVHYEILMSGIDKEIEDNVTGYLTRSDDEPVSALSLPSPSTKIISYFHNNMASGSLSGISEELFRAMDAGNASLRIATSRRTADVLQGKVRLPNTCWRLSRDHGIETTLVDATEVEDTDRYKCKYEGRLYDDGETWIPRNVNSCFTCGCKNTKVICHPVLCPLLECMNHVKITGECCPVCPDDCLIQGSNVLNHYVDKISNSDCWTEAHSWYRSCINEPLVRLSIKKNKTCFFDGDHRWHPIGTTWHPFVHPFGYAKCVLCSCLISKNEVDCRRLSCPLGSCSSSSPKTENSSECCPPCTDTQQPLDTNTPPMSVALRDKDMNGACSFHGKMYENGSWWHPNVTPFGAVRCVTCTCQNGKHKCRRMRCPRLQCKKRVRAEKTCCFKCQKRKVQTKTREELAEH